MSRTKSRSLQDFSTATVIGGGPAGCAAAYALASRGIDVVLFERGAPGKDKACGDAFIPSAIALLGSYGIDQGCVAFLGGYPFRQFDLFSEDTLFGQATLAPDMGWTIRRAVIDQFVRDVISKHVTIRYGTHVSDLTIQPHGKLELTLRTRGGSIRKFSTEASVIASGAGGALANIFGVSGKPIMSASVSAYVERPAQKEALIFQFKDAYRPGYGWLFPVSKKQQNIGVCRIGNGKSLRPLAAEHANSWGISTRLQWRGGGGPMWSGRGEIWHHSVGIVSCGDAAGLIDPATGEGITAALKSGQEAGTAISKYIEENRNLSRLDEYSHWVKQYFDRQYGKKPFRQVWDMLCRT